jgi:hypothetical protein
MNEISNLIKIAINAVQPNNLIKKCLKIKKIENKKLISISNEYLFDDESNKEGIEGEQLFEIDKNVVIIAFGKAALGKNENV